MRSKALQEELEARTEIKQSDEGYMEDNDQPNREELEEEALQDLIDLDTDYGGFFATGIIPDFKGSPKWVAKMKAEQRRFLDQQAKEHRGWKRLRQEALQELNRR